MNKLDTKGYIGIDLGTTNCVVSYINDQGEVDCIPNLDGEIITPTFLHFAQSFDGKIKTKVGAKAKAMGKEDPDNVVSSFKTLMGTPTVVKSVMGKNITSLECSELMLRYLKRSAEVYLNTTISGAVISVPAYFSEQQKDATRVAAKRAGLNVKRILTEPTAGAFYYGVNAEVDEKVVAVYDLGGGTFDVSIISIFEDTSSVLGAPNGDSKLGGDDIDRMLCKYALKQNGKSKIHKEKEEQLIRLCEEAKIDLCERITNNQYNGIPSVIMCDKVGLKPVELTRETFEQMIDPLVQRTLVCFEHALADANITAADLDEVILVGGSSRIPYIRECLEKFLKDDRFTVNYFKTYAVDPDLAVGLGCGIYLKYIFDNKEKNVTDIVPKTIGIEVEHSVFEPLINKGRAIPASKSRTFTNACDNQVSVLCKIYEGEDKIAQNNTLLGQVAIPIQPGPKNTVEVLVWTKISKDGILTVNVISSGNAPVELKVERQYKENVEDDWVGGVDLDDGAGQTDKDVNKW